MATKGSAGMINLANAGIVPVTEETKETHEEVGLPTVLNGKTDGIAYDTQAVDTDSDDASTSDSVQPGVKKIQATLSVWSKRDMIIAYCLILTIYFVNALQSSIFWTLTPYVTSSFALHSLTATTSIFSSLIGGLCKLPLAKVLDIWGRPQGFAFSVASTVIGMVMMAGCQNVETYAAAMVFYAVGTSGYDYTLSIFIADTTHLKNRGLMYAFVSSPWLITTWIGGPVVSSILSGIGFRWGFGIFAIVQPIIAFPLWFLFNHNLNKAKKAGLVKPRNSGRTVLQSLKFYAIEFDLFGILLLASGLALFLLSFSLYSYQAAGFKSPLFISFVVIGILLVVAFALFERFLAPKTFIPYGILTDRTVMGAFVLSAAFFIEFYIWDSYFYSFLIVVTNQTVTHATYITSIYTLGSCSFCVVVGLAIRYTGRFKWIALYFSVPVTTLGIALMILFRQPNVNIGYIVMCQIFIAIGGGAGVICEQIAAMAAVTQQDVAVVLAIEGTFSQIGGAIGSTIASAIWTGVFPDRLARYLPASAQGDLATIYGDITVQTSYAVGTPERDAINRAYGDAQKLMLIGSTAVMAIALVAVLFWRDINVKGFKQTKGRVW